MLLESTPETVTGATRYDYALILSSEFEVLVEYEIRVGATTSEGLTLSSSERSIHYRSSDDTMFICLTNESNDNAFRLFKIRGALNVKSSTEYDSLVEGLDSWNSGRVPSFTVLNEGFNNDMIAYQSARIFASHMNDNVSISGRLCDTRNVQFKALVFFSSSNEAYDVEVTRTVAADDSFYSTSTYKSVHTIERTQNAENMLFIVCLIDETTVDKYITIDI